jgi:hypothetical protein
MGMGSREVAGTTADVFATAVDAFAPGELPLQIDAAASVRLRGKLAAGGLVLVGERHGMAQNPLVAYTLMRRLGIRILALEWAADLGGVVERFLAAGTLDVRRLVDRDDGRITAGHFAVLRALGREGLLDRVVLYDEPVWPGTWSERDRAMATRLLDGTGTDPAVVMAGSLHTRLRRHRYGEPMGAHLARVRPGTVEVRLRYPGGAVPLSGCALRTAGAWLELTVPDAYRGVTPGA